MKHFLTLAFFIISCQQPAVEEDHKQAIEEMHDKVEKIIAEVRADCDSTVYLLAKHQADSIRKAQKRKTGRN